MEKSVGRAAMELAWRLLPDERRILERLAQAPPRLKGRLLERIARVGLDVAGYDGSDELLTNLGTDGPAVSIPIRAGRVYLFGHPAKRFGELSTIRVCRALLADAGAFVDIGAHVGLYLWPVVDLLGPTRPGYYFEPNPQLFRILEANASRLTSHLHGFDVAMHDHDGSTEFHIDLDDWSMSSTVLDPANGHRHARSAVRCVRFDSFARQVALEDAVVKSDIEGGEIRILDGLACSGRAVLDFVCEVLQPAFERGFVAEAAARLGAEAYLVGDRMVLPSARVAAWDRLNRNWLFTRRPRSDLAETLAQIGFDIG
jgi:FkbM family methyltransferase